MNAPIKLTIVEYYEYWSKANVFVLAPFFASVVKLFQQALPFSLTKNQETKNYKKPNAKRNSSKSIFPKTHLSLPFHLPKPSFPLNTERKLPMKRSRVMFLGVTKQIHTRKKHYSHRKLFIYTEIFITARRTLTSIAVYGLLFM